VHDGEWSATLRKSDKVACCDCGLVHLVKFSKQYGLPDLRYWRLTQAIGGIRRTIA
jgi:hypothetical protein